MELTAGESAYRRSFYTADIDARTNQSALQLSTMRHSFYWDNILSSFIVLIIAIKS
jgi:hypothetical protein